MPKPVIQFEDPRLGDIRTQIAQKTEEVPFVLLPLRMETRFLRVEKQPDTQPLTIEKALEALQHLNIQAFNVSQTVTAAQISSLITEIRDVTAALAVMPRVTAVQQAWLKKTLAGIQSGVTAIIAHADASMKNLPQDLNTAYFQLASVTEALTKNDPSGKTPEPAKSANNFRNQLKVRIFPDDVFVKTHEPALTANEVKSGKAFWKYWWAASNNKELETAAWNTLCTAAGSKRASWIARVLNPNNTGSAKNKAAVSSRPSQVITQATKDIDATYGVLNAILKPVTAIELFRIIRNTSPFTAVPLLCDKVIKALPGIKTDQDYLLESFKGLLGKNLAVINVYLTRIQELTQEEKAQVPAAVAEMNMIAGKFNTIKILFDAITPLDYNVFTDALPEPFEYPEVTLKDKDWSTAPHTDCLPSRFVVITMKLDAFTVFAPKFTHVAVGNPVKPNVQLGLDPNKFNNPAAFNIDSNGNLIVEDDLKWMTDYDDAVKNGLAVTLEITEKEFAEGFDRVIVLGINEGDSQVSKTTLESLFTSHMYSADGMSFLKVGTPTNNTQHKKSFLEPNSDVDQRYEIEINNKKFNPGETNKLLVADGKVLSDALGLDHAVLQYASNSNNVEIANALAMNRALWGAGIGHFMEEMSDTLFNYDNIRRTEDFFTNYCFGRGMLPSVQIGRQPYGMLVTTAFSNLKIASQLPDLTYTEMTGVNSISPPSPDLEARLQLRFDMRLHQVLKFLNDGVWKSLEAFVASSSGFFNGDQQQKFMHMLGLHATSLDYFYRYSLNNLQPPDTSTTPTGDFFGPEGIFNHFKQMMSEGIFSPSFNFIDEKPEFAAGKTKNDVLAARTARIHKQFQNSRIFAGRLIHETHHITKNVIDDGPLSEKDSVSKIKNTNTTYFDWLLNASVNELMGVNMVGNALMIPPNSLLFLMLRQSLTQAHQEAALLILQKEGILNDSHKKQIGGRSFYTYKKVKQNVYKPDYVTKWHLLYNKLADLNAPIPFPLAFPQKVQNNPFFDFMTKPGGLLTMANYLTPVNDPSHLPGKLYRASHKPEFDKLLKVREAIQTLKRVPAADLEVLFAEQVDLCSYRLDAWTLGIVNKRLQQQRSKQPKGLFLGAYGYVEDLRPVAGKVTMNDPSRLKEFSLEPNKPVYHDAESQGFIHAPSINQAMTAAVLRSAYKANTQEDVHNRLAVNISSARVRMALGLIEGIRNGQELGAILGFRFERGLHERYEAVELDKFIQPFRKAYPLSQQVQESANGSPAYVSQVVNGSDLLQEVYDTVQWLKFPSGDTIAALLKKDNYKALPGKITQAINNTLQPGDNAAAVFDAIIDEIDRMADAFDALGDLAVSESVYQIVQGNHVRAAAVLNALAQGKNIPDPQIIETNRTGTVVTHRVLLNFATSATSFATPPGWNNRGTYRSFTEPNVNYWLGTVLGDPALIKCVITTTDLNNVVHKETWSVKDLGWQPVDLFAVPGGKNELKDIIQNLYRLKNSIFNASVNIDLNERGAGWNADDRSVPEILLLLTHVRNMISNARFAGASELLGPNDEPDRKNTGNHDIAEFDKRVKAAYASLQALNAAISGEAFVSNVVSGKTAVRNILPVTGDVEKVMEHLTNAMLMGIPHALSLSFDPALDKEQRFTMALQHLLNIQKEIAAREIKAADLVAQMNGSNDIASGIEKLGELAKTVYGKTFLAVPLYTPVNAAAIGSQLLLPEAQQITRNAGLAAMESWLQNLGKVRSRMYDAVMTRQVQDIHDVPVTSLKPVQFPFAAGDYWLGMEYPAAFKPDGDKLSLLLMNETLFTAQAVQSGLIIDEWLEIIPRKEETSGVTFHYNQPDAMAPQSILVAVNPDVTPGWEWENLVLTVFDTMALAKTRGVEPEHIDKSFYNHVLPAVVSEVEPPPVPNVGSSIDVQVIMDFSEVSKPKK